MKAAELMVGDWLLFYDEDESQNIPVKIVGIDDDGWVFYEFPDGIREEGWCKKLYFIPITPEILEKNGWTYNDVDKVFYPAQLRGELPYMVGMNGVFRVRDFCEIRYVHELQHALKLCGIDKEIQL